ncbi:MAG: DUF2782 domain-containing protein [Candidatus Sedimenticola sp. PURPLELP]
MKKTVLTLSLMLTAGCVMAEDRAPVPEPPVLPPQVESGEVLEPEVTIIESDKGKVHQYSVNGRVYMVKIVPTSGPAYYLLDSDGDGELDVRKDHPTDVAIPQWVLFSW